jgi:hypothetical protein
MQETKISDIVMPGPLAGGNIAIAAQLNLNLACGIENTIANIVIPRQHSVS